MLTRSVDCNSMEISLGCPCSLFSGIEDLQRQKFIRVSGAYVSENKSEVLGGGSALPVTILHI